MSLALQADYYIGIMSGTSLDGIDAVLINFNATPALQQTLFVPYDSDLRKQLLALHQASDDELNRTAILANRLSQLFANTVKRLLSKCNLAPKNIIAIGCHGQTIRHCPEKCYTIQLVNAALLAELTTITIIADFRSRDIAAGGQGAPLVPAFHQAMFQQTNTNRVIVNIGGIANLTILAPDNNLIGFDCGPGNLLMDAWCLRHTNKNYDKDGAWAASGQVIPALLQKLVSFHFFPLAPPKSTGREMFSMQWLEGYLQGNEKPEDVQATLAQLTTKSIAQAIISYCPHAEEVYICGGGAHNQTLITQLSKTLTGKKVALTDQLNVDADWVEAFAFAWLAKQTILGIPVNLATVTGAQGNRILGAIYLN